MFTGIVQAVGKIESVTPLEKGVRLVIDGGALDCSAVALGDSICVQGACLTVVSNDGARLAFDVSRETLDCTVGLDRPGAVNLETSLALGDKLGGHLVTGHVDGTGTVLAFEPAGESKRLRLRVPAVLARYVARKGSITVDGVSLTVNQIEADTFEVNLIPHTLAITTLARLTAGATVNLEVDLIARYVERMVGVD
jgi:riboflavin synthase